jgi:YHS domain-containing protein
MSVVVLAGSGTIVAQDKGAPPWGEFLKQFEKDKLLKKPYHMDPEEGVKGLASKIRARELDVPNRKKAIRYLKDLDCVQFPEAKEMLLGLLNPEKEKFEEVRFEAAKGLRDMLERHSCNPDAAKNGKDGKDEKHASRGSQGGKPVNCQPTSCTNCNNDSFMQQCMDSVSVARKKLRGERTKPMEPLCHCKSCCDADTLNILAKTAYEMKPDGCCYEPSQRVREMAVEAIKACGIPCQYKPYYGEFEEPGPPAWDEASGKMINSGEDVPPVTEEGSAPPATEDGSVPPADSSTNAAPLSLPPITRLPKTAVPAVPAAATPIVRLNNLCLVSLTHGEQRQPDPSITAEHRGRVYSFASVEAREEFLAAPEQYAVAFGGCDPVHYVETQQAVEGRYLTQYDGRFYMFTTQENHQRFKADPSRYALKSAATGVASR